MLENVQKSYTTVKATKQSVLLLGIFEIALVKISRFTDCLPDLWWPSCIYEYLAVYT